MSQAWTDALGPCQESHCASGMARPAMPCRPVPSPAPAEPPRPSRGGKSAAEVLRPQSLPVTRPTQDIHLLTGQPAGGSSHLSQLHTRRGAPTPSSTSASSGTLLPQIPGRQAQPWSISLGRLPPGRGLGWGLQATSGACRPVDSPGSEPHGTGGLQGTPLFLTVCWGGRRGCCEQRGVAMTSPTGTPVPIMDPTWPLHPGVPGVALGQVFGSWGQNPGLPCPPGLQGDLHFTSAPRAPQTREDLSGSFHLLQTSRSFLLAFPSLGPLPLASPHLSGCQGPRPPSSPPLLPKLAPGTSVGPWAGPGLLPPLTQPLPGLGWTQIKSHTCEPQSLRFRRSLWGLPSRAPHPEHLHGACPSSRGGAPQRCELGWHHAGRLENPRIPLLPGPAQMPSPCLTSATAWTECEAPAQQGEGLREAQGGGRRAGFPGAERPAGSDGGLSPAQKVSMLIKPRLVFSQGRRGGSVLLCTSVCISRVYCPCHASRQLLSGCPGHGVGGCPPLVMDGRLSRCVALHCTRLSAC